MPRFWVMSVNLVVKGLNLTYRYNVGTGTELVRAIFGAAFFEGPVPTSAAYAPRGSLL